MAMIEVRDLKKEFIVTKKESGLLGALKNVVKSEKTVVRAVNGVSFTIGEGEIVGYIGPNGAGKSTTVKMMSGILQPTSGSVTIGGLSPHTHRKQVVKRLGVVFGQRSQLYWDLRLGESFELLKRIYDVPDELYRQNLKKLDDILGIGELADTPVRQLSLGQRMRGDLAAAVLHSPPVIFLDEPTIGLDVDVKYAVRKFIREINENYRTTIILTTHDLDDIEQLCNRVIIINKGLIIEDGPLGALMDRLAPTRTIIVDFLEPPAEDLHIKNAAVVRQEQARVWIEFEKGRTCAGDIISQLSAPIRDISFDEAGIEDVIRKIYADAK